MASTHPGHSYVMVAVLSPFPVNALLTYTKEIQMPLPNWQKYSELENNQF
jgi:hypothetical protein